MSGSSPHTRGTQSRCPPVVTRCRFIPAYAGNAYRRALHGAKQPGSSPHTRGTLDDAQFHFLAGRFIPAYAGNAVEEKQAVYQLPVHPRIRGERRCVVSDWRSNPGSSPHTRGTHWRDLGRGCRGRFIPAYAGNANPLLNCPGRSPVHPRIRGERQTADTRPATNPGSSPHTRGTRGEQDQDHSRARFIPAYAGNAPSSRGTSRRFPVHPRIRGERPNTRFSRHGICGSSPHTRGTLPQHRGRNRRIRFIPAYAGNARQWVIS